MIFDKDEERQRAVDWLTGEIQLAQSEMEGRIKKWNRWRRQREARPEFEKKTFPGSNRVASNVVPPISMSLTNTTYANLNNKFGSAINPFWTISAVKDTDVEELEIAKVLTKHFMILSEGKNDLDRRRRSKTVHYETGSLGYCAVKVPWTRREWIITETDPATGAPFDSVVKLHDGPEIVPIPAEDFLIREAYQDIQTAPWCAHVLHKTWPEIEQLGEQGFYEGVDELEKWARVTPTDSEEEQQAREGAQQLNDSGIWDLHEVYFFFDVNGRWRDCLITLEVNSGLVLRESYNELGWRPIEGFEFLLRPHRREGLGVGHITDHMQEEGTMLHNARNDSIHASVIPMFAARKNSGPKADEPIYPAKIWMLDDPGKDLTVMKLPEPGMASLQAENMTLMYAQKGVGSGDASGGFADQTIKTRDSPGLMNMRIKQSSGVFGSISEGIEDSWSMIGYLILLQEIHHKDEVIANEREIGRLTEEEIATLEKALSIPKAQVPIRLKFKVRTSDVEQTFEMKRQNLLTRTQLSGMFFQQVFPVVQMLFGPQGQQMMQMAPEMWKFMARIYTSRCRMMEEAIKFFGEDDTGKYVPEYQKLEAMLDFQKLLVENQGMMGGLVNGQGQGQGAIPGAAEASQGGGFGGTGGAPAEAGGQAAPSGPGGAPAGGSAEPGVGGVF